MSIITFLPSNGTLTLTVPASDMSDDARDMTRARLEVNATGVKKYYTKKYPQLGGYSEDDERLGTSPQDDAGSSLHNFCCFSFPRESTRGLGITSLIKAFKANLDYKIHLQGTILKSRHLNFQ